ncbi:nucleotide-binding protein [Vibrio sp. JC009]|uniref:TIR domain-containing protein n=1 Tax=Vibrio sp. JC009 TaxID=2912314 RepID=UPI0023AEA9EB|nr:TIR domain-containing protein [Vibrio sp. JC009]WED23094.1 nucleotide-binding protein [Vibrio sp. JC009]
MSISKELFRYSNELDEFTSLDAPEVKKIKDVAQEVGQSWSGSWLGYHSRVYYNNFQVPPPGAAFSGEWGLKDIFSSSLGSRGDWCEYDFNAVVDYILAKAGKPKTEKYFVLSEEASEKFDDIKSSVLSLVHSNFSLDDDKFLAGLVEKIEEQKIFTEAEYIQYLRPSGQIISRDMIAIEKGCVTPPHIAVEAKYFAMGQPFISCKDLQSSINKLASHIQNLEKQTVKEERIGTNIFIGHGRSYAWRDLKDFVNERLNLPWDEFNRVPIAGVTNITRLAQMLDQACIAFLVMTAEDEQADGDMHARMNVIHEVGLFQGRLGFERAIVLLEEGCQEFSNIQGLGQIRFPKGNISAIFEDIRLVLEREGIID